MLDTTPRHGSDHTRGNHDLQRILTHRSHHLFCFLFEFLVIPFDLLSRSQWAQRIGSVAFGVDAWRVGGAIDFKAVCDLRGGAVYHSVVGGIREHSGTLVLFSGDRHEGSMARFLC
ncbi:hypothetical protein ACFWXB_01705 [Tsukamurella tyrosinosolvens]|uniref:hypothetical protein n=1 Tax=Tsukamurella tyrosinosolvens TaxID=57704 RepID=UPI003691C39A